MIAAETFFQLVRDPAHWLFELTVEGATALILSVPIRKLVHRHDRKVHNK